MLDTRNDELELFKKNINLIDFAAAKYNFKVDKSKSSKNSVSMSDETGRHIVVSVSPAGHWQYFSTDGQDSGTIVDFVQKLEGCNLGFARKLLRQWNGVNEVATRNLYRAQKKEHFNREPICRLLRRFKPIKQSSYLAGRGISTDLINSNLFTGRVLEGYNKAVIFPHWDSVDYCGYEVCKPGFKTFAADGRKGLWSSNRVKGLESLVFAESPLECFSYYELFSPDNTEFFTGSGNWSIEATNLIKSLSVKLPGKQLTVIAAFNNDLGGDGQVARLRDIVDADHIDFVDHRPPNRGDDWNDVLMNALSLKK